jgi:hypothetical protein
MTVYRVALAMIPRFATGLPYFLGGVNSCRKRMWVFQMEMPDTFNL